ncbi:uncharacterized protein LOC105025852 isoform X2 [Esox lucius]|nr:uncharacterized protein LOC105025852 isoform X2 [Esox lucius]
MYYCITYCQQFLTMAFADNSTQTWSQKETKVLISIWSNEKILQKLERSYRKKPVYGEISERLNEHGFKRTWKQCQIKIKDLKFLYRRARMKPSNSRPSPFFAKLKEFLGDIDDPPLPLPSLRLFVPPLRLVSAALWQVVQQGDIMDYGLVEEFVTTVLEVVPDMMSYREKVQLVMGLRAKLVLELCRSEQSADPETIQPHLSRIRTFIMTHTEKEIPDPEVEASETKFLELVQTLLVNPKMREHFFQEVFPVEFGPMYDTALQTLMWEFLSRLEKLLPTPTFQETASWLRPAPSLLKECAQTVTQPHPLKTLLLHHRCHSPLFSNVQPSCVNDHILSSLSQILPEKVEIDIYGIRSESTYSPRNCPIHNNDGATVKEENNVENELGMNSDIVIKKPVEITNVRTEDLEEKHYEEILSHDKPVDVVKVEVVDADDVSQTSSTTHIVGRSWSLEETKALITIWSNEEILQKFGKWYRNKHVYTEISQLLNDLGFKRTWKQCQTKIKDMKYSYRRALKNPSSSSPVSFSFFSELHTFLSRMPYLPGSKETGQVSDGEEMSMDQDEGPSVDVYLEEPLHEEITSREVTQKTVTAEETDKIKGHEAFHSFQSHSMKIEVETPSCKQAMEDVSELNLQPVVLLPRIHDNILMTVHPSCVNDPILSSLPHLVSEKLKMDIDETCVESGCTPGTCTMYNNESDTLKEENCAGNELGVCLEMTDVSNKDLEEDYGEMLKNHKPADLANVGIEDVSQTSSTTHIVGRSWSLEETKALITIWSNEEILQKFGKWYRNKHVYTEISQLLNDLGFKRTWKQCQTKIKDMKYSYRRALKNPSSSSPVSFSFFSELHTFLSRMPYLPGSKETGQVSDGEEMSMDQDEGPSVDVYLEEPPCDKMSCRKATEKTVNGEQTEESKCDEAVQSPQSDSKINFSRQSHCCDPKVEDQSELPLSEKELMSSTSVTLSIDDRRAQNCNWTTDETKMLISLWSNKPILQELQHSYRKHHVYLNISKQLNNLGYKKTWKQCQTKIKDMKYSYRRALRNPKSSGRVPCSFYSELHAFLSVMPDSKERGVVSGGEVMSLDQNDNVDVNSEDSPLEEMASGKETRKTLRAEQTEEIKGDGAFHSPRSDEVICMERETNTCQQVAEDFKPLVLLPQLQSNVPRTRG